MVEVGPSVQKERSVMVGLSVWGGGCEEDGGGRGLCSCCEEEEGSSEVSPPWWEEMSGVEVWRWGLFFRGNRV